MIDWFTGFVGRIVTAIGSTDLTATGMAIIQSLWDGMVAKFNELIGWVTSIPGRIRDAIGRIDLSNIVSWPKLPTWAGGSPAPKVGDGEARAKGGPVNAGSLYTVGERGPELFVPNVSGRIVPNGALEQMRSQSTVRSSPAASGGASVSVGDIKVVVNPSPGMDEAALADKVARSIDKAIKDAFSGGHWNGGYSVA